MIKSMTAFARKDQQLNDITISWEIRSVNHRYLDVSLSLPESLSAIENKLKGQVRNILGRGKIDAKLSLNSQKSEGEDEILINKDKVKALLSARHMLESISKKPVLLSGIDILSWPGVLDKPKEKTKSYEDDVVSLLNEALQDLVATREDEGARLLAMLESRCEQISTLVKAVRERRVDVIATLRDKILKRLADIDVTADPNRLEQEMVFQANRLDVDEELDRLDAHIEEIKDVLKRDEPVGRRLDFLMQELHREANTLSSKSNDAETTRAAVELKVLTEQMREQVMNVE